MKKLIAVRIERADLDTLAKIGQREDRTTSYLIQKAIKQFIARNLKGKS
jgi:predicted transcriptional regulator